MSKIYKEWFKAKLKLKLIVWLHIYMELAKYIKFDDLHNISLDQ